MNFGICEWALPVSGPLAIMLAREAGYDGIQLGEVGGREMGYPLCHPRVQEIYRKTADHCGVELHSLNLGALLAEGTMDYDKGTRQGAYARESLSAGFEVCRKLDIHTVVITVGPQTDEATKNVVEHLQFAVEIAADSEVEIALESALPLAQIQGIRARAGAEIKICMDILNPLRFGTGNPQEQIRAFGRDQISHFHMKDSISGLFQPGQRGCVLLGHGDAGYEDSVEIIRRLSYDGWLISENYYYLPPMSCETDDFLQLAAKDLNTLQSSFPS